MANSATTITKSWATGDYLLASDVEDILKDTINNIIDDNNSYHMIEKASGTNAMKASNTTGLDAGGENAVVFGDGTTANGDDAISGGLDSQAGGNQSISWGDTCYANGNNSASFGLNNNVSGAYSFAAGSSNNVSGDKSGAVGYNITISSDKTFGVNDLYIKDISDADSWTNVVISGNTLKTKTLSKYGYEFQYTGTTSVSTTSTSKTSLLSLSIPSGSTLGVYEITADSNWYSDTTGLTTHYELDVDSTKIWVIRDYNPDKNGYYNFSKTYFYELTSNSTDVSIELFHWVDSGTLTSSYPTLKIKLVQ